MRKFQPLNIPSGKWVSLTREGPTRPCKGLLLNCQQENGWPWWGPAAQEKPPLPTCFCALPSPVKASFRSTEVRYSKSPPINGAGKVSYVPQNPYLFYGTVAENISLGRPGASMDEVREAAELAGAHDFIMKFPRGYDTPVGEFGLRLSGGQAQRLAIARAFLKDAPLLILDEATEYQRVVS